MRSSVGQWMTWGAMTVRPEEQLLEALARMEEHGVHHLVVVADRELRGVITAEGALVAIYRDPAQRNGLRGVRVAEAMSSAPLPTAEPETPLKMAAQRMLAYGATALPILGPEGEVVGILTARDLLSALVAGAAVRHPED